MQPVVEAAKESYVLGCPGASIDVQGGGTDLTVGLLPTSRWIGGGDATVDGVLHMANLPTEEVFTSPDPERTEGFVRATKPLTTQGRIIDGLTIRFEAGRAVQIDADSGAETLRALVEQDEGGARLGELALVEVGARLTRVRPQLVEGHVDQALVGSGRRPTDRGGFFVHA